MSSPQENTKIELVTEAIESLVLAQVVMLRPDHDRFTGPRAHGDVVAARKGVHDALKELLRPTLRVVTQVENKVGEISRTVTKTIERTDAMPKF